MGSESVYDHPWNKNVGFWGKLLDAINPERLFHRHVHYVIEQERKKIKDLKEENRILKQELEELRNK